MRRFNRAFGADVSIPVRALRGHPVPLLYTVRYYLEHPQARAELTNGTALDRIRRGDLLPSKRRSEHGTAKTAAAPIIGTT